MLQQQKHIANLPGLAQMDQLLLQAQPVGIADNPEMDDGNHVVLEIIGPAAAPRLAPTERARIWGTVLSAGYSRLRAILSARSNS